MTGWIIRSLEGDPGVFGISEKATITENDKKSPLYVVTTYWYNIYIYTHIC